jgi:DNA-directed RNA polymerase specialized sigma24 family protein
MADPKHDASAVGPTLPEIQRALDEHYTVAVRDTAHRFAELRAALVRKAGWPIPKNYPKELVHDAYVSIWLGLRRWDPERMPLHARLCWIIKDRTWREIGQANRRQHVVFDVAANDPKVDIEGALAVGGVAASAHGATQMEIVVLARQVVVALLDLARKDPEARAIVGCWAQGFIEREDVCALTRMTTATYHAARERILRLSKRLPPELREAAQNLLRRVS